MTYSIETDSIRYELSPINKFVSLGMGFLVEYVYDEWGRRRHYVVHVWYKDDRKGTEVINQLPYNEFWEDGAVPTVEKLIKSLHYNRHEGTHND